MGRVLPQGLSAGEVALVIGAPGAGKSRLALSLCQPETCRTGFFYVGTRGEMGVDLLLDLVSASGLVDRGAASISNADFPLVVVDSLLGISSSGSQDRVLEALRAAATDAGTAVVLLSGNHATGAAAGPRSVVHLADYAVRVGLSAEPSVRIVTTEKSRRSPAPLVAAAEHTAAGLIKAVVEDAATSAADRALIADTQISVALVSD